MDRLIVRQLEGTPCSVFTNNMQIKVPGAPPYRHADGSVVCGEPQVEEFNGNAVSTGKTTIVFTRMRAPYVNRDGLRFKIHRKGWFSDLGKRLGMQDIEVGFPDFDEEFIIQGNNPEQIRRLFISSATRELIQAQPSINLEVKDDEGWFGESFPEGVDELHFSVTGIIKDIDRLKELYELFGEVLNNLCRIGSAYEDEPGVNLK